MRDRLRMPDQTSPIDAGFRRAGGFDSAGRIAFARRLASDPDGGPSESGMVGGRAAALRRLCAIDPIRYAQSRNHLSGAVTGLSPWIRHGMVTVAEVRDYALLMAASPGDGQLSLPASPGGRGVRPADASGCGGGFEGRAASPPPARRTGSAAHPAAKLVSELGWRDYWRRVQASLGDAIHADLEPPAAARRTAWSEAMPADVLAGTTGMACVDAFVLQLHRTGWLHNHARMWLASWLVHVRGVHWQAGAAWFLAHLLDGDPASNTLSWQWVAGTFSSKPYLFNRENLDRHSDGVFCRPCPLVGHCSLEGGYEDLARRLFEPDGGAIDRRPPRIAPAAAWEGSMPAGEAVSPTLVWLTLDSLGAVGPAVVAHPHAPRVFIVDPAWLLEERPTVKRLVFILECLADLPDTEIVVGDPASVLLARARELGCRTVAVADTPCPRVRRATASLAGRLPVAVHRWPRFVDDARIRDLGRFSRYWRDAEDSAMRPSG